MAKSLVTRKNASTDSQWIQLIEWSYTAAQALLMTVNKSGFCIKLRFDELWLTNLRHWLTSTFLDSTNLWRDGEAAVLNHVQLCRLGVYEYSSIAFMITSKDAHATIPKAVVNGTHPRQCSRHPQHFHTWRYYGSSAASKTQLWARQK